MSKKLKLSFCFIGMFILVICSIFFIPKNDVNKKDITSSSTNNIKKQDDTTKNNINNKQEHNIKNVELTSENIDIPVLCYHDVTPNNPNNNDLLLNPNKLKEQLKWLKDNGYTSINLEDFYNYLKNNKEIPKKSVIITFDDGYKDSFTYAYPILKEMNFTATFFIISNFIGKGYYMDKNDITELIKNGFNIESHTDNHVDLSKLNYNEQLKSLKESKEHLENITKKSVDFIAYPYGKYNNETRLAAKNAGYKLGFNVSGHLSDKNDNDYNIDRIYISNSYTLEHFANKIKNATK